jgi:type II secretory pathway predicted ATPase ExeA
MIEIEVYYGLTGLPFDKSIKSEEIFLSASAKELLSRLEYMKQHRGLMLITGEPGTGKTTILRAFVDGLSQLSYQSFYVPLSTVNILDFYRQLNYHLGGQALHLKSTLFRSIQKAIKDFVTHSKKIPLIIFDEAHLFKNENFFELQIITNFNMDSTDPAIFILAAQSHLRDRLSRSFLNSFNQRIQLKYHLVPLQREEVEPYLNHHLAIVGCQKPPFTQGAIEAIYKNTGGVPRLIGSLALKTMTQGFLEKADVLTQEHVFAATYEL